MKNIVTVFLSFSRRLFFVGSALLILCATGCGDSSGNVDNTPPTITRVGTGITTTPATLTAAGGTATIQVDITDASGVDSSSVKVDVTTGGTSLLGGAQAMTSLSSVQNRWAYPATLPANTSTTADKVYSVTVTARDLRGNQVSPPYVVGIVTVPHQRDTAGSIGNPKRPGCA